MALIKILVQLVVCFQSFDESDCLHLGLVAWRSGNTFHLISEVTLCRAGLVLRWMTACGQVNYFGMQPAA